MSVEIQIKENKIYSPIRQKWLIKTPEEEVRQKFLLYLVNELGYSIDQIAEEESVVGRGSAGARADFLIWKNKEDKKKNQRAFIVVECKADYVNINYKDYEQGDRYARQENAELFITHNSKETKIFKVNLEQRPKTYFEIEKIPTCQELNNEKELKKIYNNLKEFREDEFANILKNCHDIIRDTEKLDPAAAFDEIAKILFMKVYAERILLKGKKENIFTKHFIEEAEKYTTNYLSKTFEDTKSEFAKNEIFTIDEKIELKNETIKLIIQKLQIYNLSKTSSDVKGLAFERFLGKTFRGEIGQFFTPRPVVEFMVDFICPEFNKTICDPASGSGGFLIKYFEKVREQIENEYKNKYEQFCKHLDKGDDYDKKLNDKQNELKKTYLDRLDFLSTRIIYGTDANERMARTSKMNMIMHGDGHGGIHHNDGLYNIDGIFEERFDCILTNPPFGAKVRQYDKVKFKNITSKESEEYYIETYGDLYTQSIKKWQNRENEPINKYYDIKKGDTPKTEILFLERCLNLVKKGGTIGIVLPEGILNNPSLREVRKFCEHRAKILAVISIPQNVFTSAKATVKTSLLFMKKFDDSDLKDFETAKANAQKEAVENEEIKRLASRIDGDKKQLLTRTGNELKAAKKKLKAFEQEYQKQFDKIVEKAFRINFNYPIFMAEAENAGITTTGEIDTQNNELPNILTEYKKFRANEKSYQFEK